jgi:hypothetical protein
MEHAEVGSKFVLLLLDVCHAEQKYREIEKVWKRISGSQLEKGRSGFVGLDRLGRIKLGIWCQADSRNLWTTCSGAQSLKQLKS